MDREILSYLGALAKRDPEGFVYPRPARISEKIGRTSYYVSQRVKFLARIGRLIPAVRQRHRREVKGWLVIRYKDWIAKQDQAVGSSPSAPADAEKDLGSSSNRFANSANNSGSAEVPDDRNGHETQRVAGKANRRSTGLGNPSLAGQAESLSQSTTSTTTATTPSGNGSFRKKEKKETLNDRLARKISRGQGTLMDLLVRSCQESKKDREFMADFIRDVSEACTFLAYPFDKSDPTLTFKFCEVLWDTWEEFRDRLRSGEMTPSIFCSKVIDRCLGDCKTLWPPSFTAHRNRLRRAENAGHLEFVSDSQWPCSRVDRSSLEERG